MDVATLVLQLAFYLLFAATLIAFVRRPGPLTLDTLLMFAALAGLFAIQFLRLVVPVAPEALRFAGVALLLAQPGLALRLTRHVRHMPGWVGLAMLAGYLITLSVLVLLGTAHPLTVLLIVAYFLIGDGAAALLIGREAVLRTGVTRWRLALAATAMALLALAILGAAAGGPTGSAIARGVAVVAALAFLLAFVPPRWLRRLGQQAVAYRYLTNLVAIRPGFGVEPLWRLLATAAAELTGAFGVEVRLATEGAPATAVSTGTVDGTTPPSAVVRFGLTGTRRGEVRLWSRAVALFAEDDLLLLELLGSQTLAAVEREAALAERTTMAERLATTNAALVEASAAKSDFLAAMSHELRTPLNAIIGFSELLLTPPAHGRHTVATTREYAGHIHGAGLHLLDLINEILDLARIEANRLDLRPVRIDVATLVRETLATVRPLAESKSQTLEASLPAGLEAEVDPARLRQVVYNLLSNAIKFTPAEGRVTVVLIGADGELQLSVRDTGPGIPLGDQERIFAAFEQVNPGAGGGAGLGLALTRRLVEAHGGRIQLESAPGSGSRFLVVLPTQHRETIEPTSVEPPPGIGPLLLVVEDDAAAAELLRLHLGDAGYRTAVAVDGESGLTAARDLEPAAILLDILLPGQDGWEVLKQLRSDPATSGIPVLVITIVDNAALGLALGAVDYFVKPVSREVLLSALARLTFMTKLRQGTVTVLAIDDDPSSLALYRSTLATEGFRVLEAATGGDGLALASSEPVDLIVLDLLLPDLDGFEVAARLKANPATARIPILVITGEVLSAEDKARLNDHVLTVLTKGDEGLSGLRQWLARARAQPLE